MEFEREEIELVKSCITKRKIQLRKFIEEWEKATYDNISNMKNMFNGKNAFEECKNNYIQNWKNELEKLEELQERIYSEE